MCPAGVDPENKELALCDEEFNNVLKMTNAEFAEHPLWKKENMTKELKRY